ncbi:MAG: hypothetical protein RLZ98_2122 [Pseudomonadota bacterium]|jgi:peptidoglycan/xylan/chitin deacetylase (PgdA/CDA1 family)
MGGRRDQAAGILQRSGVLRLLEAAPRRRQLLVLNYHRIGDPDASEFDREVFSETAEGLAAQVSFLKRSYNLVSPAEALEMLDGRWSCRGTSILLTFDDGYRDNLDIAVPVLQSLDASAIFFLVTSYLDRPSVVTWWDRIAWLTRRCVDRKVTVTVPEPLTLEINSNNVEWAASEMLRRARENASRLDELIDELRTAAGCDCDNGEIAQFMSWHEASQLQDAGMTIGLHTHSHRILSSLSEDEQARELIHSRNMMQERLGVDCRIIAYPVGTRAAFTDATKRIARECGYRYAFSFYGGSNLYGRIDPMDILRASLPSRATRARARSAVAGMAVTGSVWF